MFLHITGNHDITSFCVTRRRFYIVSRYRGKFCIYDCTSQVSRHVHTYPGFCSMKQLGVFLLLLAHCRLTSQQQIRRYSFIQLGEERHGESEAHVLPKNTTQCPGQASNTFIFVTFTQFTPLTLHLEVSSFCAISSLQL